jgi:hypothetical protein
MLSLRPGASARHLIRHSADRDTPNDTFSSRRRLWANEIRRHDEEGSAARGPHPALRATFPVRGEGFGWAGITVLIVHTE